MAKPNVADYPVYFQRYINLVEEEDLYKGFESQLPAIKQFLSGITEEQSLFAYEAGKWTLKEVLQHIIDTERIFNFRALCFARKEQANIPGFDENNYAANSKAGERSWQHLVDEFIAVRESTTFLFKSFSEEVLDYKGTANNNPVSVSALGFMTLGHFYHHQKVMKERYL